MKNIAILVGVLSSLFANILAEKTITCEVSDASPTVCDFLEITIGPNGNVTIKTDPDDVDDSQITTVWFRWSSIYSVPSEIFAKFPNLKRFHAWGQEVQEIKPNTFANGKQLEWIDLSFNELTFLHFNTFKGESYNFSFFISLQ
jgi:hypothetical protein